MPASGLLRVLTLFAGFLAFASCVDGALTPPPGNGSPLNSDVKWVIIAPASATLQAGSSVQLGVQLQDGNRQAVGDQTVHWTSADTSIAVVSQSGVVQARKAGVVKVSAQAGATSAQAQVNVTTAAPPTIYVSVSPASATVTVGASRQIWASVKYADGKAVTGAQVAWLSSNTAVATVSQSGLVTAVCVGSAAVTARSGTGSAAVAVTVAGAPASPPPPSTPPATPPPPPTNPAPGPPTGSLFSGYSTVSPHWQHIRTMMTDFYYSWTPSERTWAGQHYDYAMSGDVNAWRAANPGVRHYRYALAWTTLIYDPTKTDKPNLPTLYYNDMVTWYAAHPEYRLETAFLHQVGQPADSSHRLKYFAWTNENWPINPADAGAIAYSVDRFQRIAQGEDGIFVDATASGDIANGGHVAPSQEFSDAGAYLVAYAAMLGRIKAALGTKVLMLNTGPYTKSTDLADLLASGATHLEKVNNPFSGAMSDNWAWMDRLLSAGVFVDLVDALDYDDMNAVATKYIGGSISADSAYRRTKMWELASYYMVVPATPDQIALQLVNMWNHPYSSLWLKAQEANIGHPTGPRKLQGGLPAADPAGNPVKVFTRDFDRALVVIRPVAGWNAASYGDPTAITMSLPSGETWLPLHPDGSLGAAVTSITLRNAESVILIKQRTIN